MFQRRQKKKKNQDAPLTISTEENKNRFDELGSELIYHLMRNFLSPLERIPLASTDKRFHEIYKNHLLSKEEDKKELQDAKDIYFFECPNAIDSLKKLDSIIHQIDNIVAHGEKWVNEAKSTSEQRIRLGKLYLLLFASMVKVNELKTRKAQFDHQLKINNKFIQLFFNDGLYRSKKLQAQDLNNFIDMFNKWDGKNMSFISAIRAKFEMVFNNPETKSKGEVFNKISTMVNVYLKELKIGLNDNDASLRP